MARNLEIAIRVRTDLERAVGEMRQLERGLDRSGRSAERAARRARSYGRSLEAVSQQVGVFQRHVQFALRYAAPVAGGFGVGAVLEAASAWQRLGNRLRTVTASAAEVEPLRRALIRIAADTRTSAEATIESYARLAKAAEGAGRSQREMLRVQKVLGQATALGGSSSEEAANALRQLGQGLSAGALRGDEFNSVMEQLPGVADAVVAGLRKTGAAGEVTRGRLRELAAAGELTAEVLIDALLAAGEEVDEQGLSPRVRGNRGGSGPPDDARGSIPASAGEPISSSPGQSHREVYPRECGGTRPAAVVAVGHDGLSPRVRGNPPGGSGWRPGTRSIPASAGEPGPPPWSQSDTMVYPRECGGTRPEVPVGARGPGLSPRVRGNPQRQPAHDGAGGARAAHASRGGR